MMWPITYCKFILKNKIIKPLKQNTTDQNQWVGLLIQAATQRAQRAVVPVSTKVKPHALIEPTRTITGGRHSVYILCIT